MGEAEFSISKLDVFEFAESPHSDPLVAMVQRNNHITRSGDIYIIQDPYWFLYETGPVVAMHGSPWRFDTHVPIIFTGPGIQPGRVHRLVHPVDVAPTIAALLGMTQPASAQGTPLEEVEIFDRSNGFKAKS